MYICKIRPVPPSSFLPLPLSSCATGVRWFGAFSAARVHAPFSAPRVCVCAAFPSPVPSAGTLVPETPSYTPQVARAPFCTACVYHASPQTCVQTTVLWCDVVYSSDVCSHYCTVVCCGVRRRAGHGRLRQVHRVQCRGGDGEQQRRAGHLARPPKIRTAAPHAHRM